MAEVSSETIQAACVAIGARGVLIEARDDAQRTDLLLRLIDRGATLVSDVRTACARRANSLIAAPAGAAGQLEIRGIGAVEMESLAEAEIALIVVVLEAAPRLPEDRRFRNIAGIAVPVLALGPAEPAAPIKVDYALKAFAQ
ncbi:aldolase [Sphingomonas sp. HITSZ_GF]|uniref:HPr kinase/phosphorylase n=1 Tax=Sphingomonas sp. HITSZ_GF TaxID=3037247 RepID=UPI00240D639A|nr:aldolase [Sphingomonas sp. HITSZ_GF]MDG2532699.1 aldolase [Sphingomonas sp. HITSZ_GF]